jgi:methylated-DNA-[protein]-cysteine S-methyltransferase
MSSAHPACRQIETDLVAVATGEASLTETRRVEEHTRVCAACRDDLDQYREVEGIVGSLRQEPLPGADPTLARAELEAKLADIRTRLVSFRRFVSPLGPLVIARTELGVSLIEYLGPEQDIDASRLARMGGGEAVEDGAEMEALYRELVEYLEGRRARLDWPIDFRSVKGNFQRRVLDATVRLPYGAVASYAGIAREIGAPRAVRAVAQALRHNPVPIAIPCHRVIGSSGSLTGYAGDKVALKQRLLAVEGVHAAETARDFRIDRRRMYHLMRYDSEYCLPTCGSLLARPLADFTLFGLRERAEAVGLRPCSSCRPDVNPLPR